MPLYGAETPRDGVTLGARRALRPLVLPAEIARLDSLAGYLKLPGARPVARIRLRYRKRPKVAERFVPRVEGENVAGEVAVPEEAERDLPRPRSAATRKSGAAVIAVGDEPEAVPEDGSMGIQTACGRWGRTGRGKGERNRCAASRSALASPAGESGMNDGKTKVVWTDPNAKRLEADAEPRDALQPESLKFPEEIDGSNDADRTPVRETARTEVDLDVGPDDDGKPPSATVNRKDVRGGKSPDGARPEGGMIPI